MMANAMTNMQDRASTQWIEELLRDPAYLFNKTGHAAPALPSPALDALRQVLVLVDEYARIDARRGLYYARIATTLIPDSVELHWRVTGREFLEGAIAYTVARCERWAEFYGEASFASLLAFLTGTDPYAEQIDGAASPSLIDEDKLVDLPVEEVTDPDGKTIKKAIAPAGLGQGRGDATGGDANVDAIEEILAAWIAEAEDGGYSLLCRQQLQATKLKPDKERGSVISTAAGAIALFKNPAIRAGTMRSSYPLSALRGVTVTDPATGTDLLLPVTVYMVVPVAEAEALGRLTALYMEAAGEILLSQDDDWVKREAEKKRLRPSYFVVDEFWTLPELNVLFMIPALGRGLGVGLSMYGQSKQQIALRYRDARSRIEILASSCNQQVYLSQNDHGEAEGISKLIGNRTVWDRRVTHSRGGGSTSYDKRGIPLASPQQIMSLQRLDPARRRWGRQIVMISGSFSTPIDSEVPCWFRDRNLQPRGKMPIETHWRDLAFAQGFRTPGDIGAASAKLAERSAINARWEAGSPPAPVPEPTERRAFLSLRALFRAKHSN